MDFLIAAKACGGGVTTILWIIAAVFVIAMSQDLAGPTAWVDASMDVVMAVLAFGIVPMTQVWGRLLDRRAPRVIESRAGYATR